MILPVLAREDLPEVPKMAMPEPAMMVPVLKMVPEAPSTMPPSNSVVPFERMVPVLWIVKWEPEWPNTAASMVVGVRATLL